jgi:hypothetical protein
MSGAGGWRFQFIDGKRLVQLEVTSLRTISQDENRAVAK